jgi:excisionase family DNA binding protein
MLFNVNEVCKQLSIGRTLVYRLIKDGDLEVVKLHGRTLITRVSVERLIKARMAMAA